MRQRPQNRRSANRQRHRRGAESGFSLVEIAISILVLGLGFASLLSVVTVGIKWSQDAISSSTGQFAAETWKAKGSIDGKVGELPMVASIQGDCQIGGKGKEFFCVGP